MDITKTVDNIDYSNLPNELNGLFQIYFTTIVFLTYKKSNQLWHVGGVGTFRTSLIANKKLKLGVVVLSNAKGKASANAHYIAKMLYSELKNNRIGLKEKYN